MVLGALSQLAVVFWDMAPCSLVVQFQHVGVLLHLVWYMVPIFWDITLLFGYGTYILGYHTRLVDGITILGHNAVVW